MISHFKIYLQLFVYVGVVPEWVFPILSELLEIYLFSLSEAELEEKL